MSETALLGCDIVVLDELVDIEADVRERRAQLVRRLGDEGLMRALREALLRHILDEDEGRIAAVRRAQLAHAEAQDSLISAAFRHAFEARPHARVTSGGPCDRIHRLAMPHEFAHIAADRRLAPHAEEQRSRTVHVAHASSAVGDENAMPERVADAASVVAFDP
jgi:hypothetical protein